MAVAKVKRDLGSSGYNWYEWWEFSTERGYKALNKGERQQLAKETGQTEAEIENYYAELYSTLQAEWHSKVASKSVEETQVKLIRNNTLDSACAVYQRADRILTGLPIQVQITDEAGNETPAWNDGKVVTFNAGAIKEIDSDSVTSLHGLNYHELSHLLFTPRAGSALGAWVREKSYENVEYTAWDGTEATYARELPADPQRVRAFNILEDCRAEYYLTLKYPSVRPFLVALIGDYIATHPDIIGSAFILLGGRRYFPQSVRQLSADQYRAQFGAEQAQKVYAILSEYRTLVFPRDYERAKELILAFMEYVPEGMDTPNGCSDRPVMRNGKPDSEKTQDTLRSNDPAGDKDGLNLEDANNYSEDASSEGATYNPNTANWREKDEELVNEVKRAVELAKTDKAVTSKVRDTVKAIAKSTSAKSILTRKNAEKEQPTQREVMASRLFAQELERLRIDADPAWEREKPSGKLNVRRAMNADVNDYGKLFDRWETGNDDHEIEACILLDRSGSMFREIGSVCRSSWIIKRALEKINGRVTVMTFSEVSNIIADADERADSSTVLTVESGGGTNPYYALLESERLFFQSTRPTKLMFLLTDGGFNPENDEIIKRMNAKGVHTNLIYLTSDEHSAKHVLATAESVEHYTHGAMTFNVIFNPSDLLAVAKDVVRHFLKKAK